uniref:Uncharacterized protein n=1 Tax=Oryza brachyantha TaxID=4533 RepID=J3MQ05_ORYBR
MCTLYMLNSNHKPQTKPNTTKFNQTFHQPEVYMSLSKGKKEVQFTCLELLLLPSSVLPPLSRLIRDDSTI